MSILPAASYFAHRNNRDGTVDSICVACFMTVATEGSESELLEIEKQHDCKELARIKEGPRRMVDVEIALQKTQACLAASAHIINRSNETLALTDKLIRRSELLKRPSRNRVWLCTPTFPEMNIGKERAMAMVSLF